MLSQPVTVLEAEVPLWGLIVAVVISGLVFALNALASYEDRKSGRSSLLAAESLILVVIAPAMLGLSAIGISISVQGHDSVLGFSLVVVPVVIGGGSLAALYWLYGALYRWRPVAVERVRSPAFQLARDYWNRRVAMSGRGEEGNAEEELVLYATMILAAFHAMSEIISVEVKTLRESGAKPSDVARESRWLRDVQLETIQEIWRNGLSLALCPPTAFRTSPPPVCPTPPPDPMAEIDRWEEEQIAGLDPNMEPSLRETECEHIHKEAERRRAAVRQLQKGAKS